MNAQTSRLVPTPVKLLAAVPVLLAANQAKATIIYTDLGSGLTDTQIFFNFQTGTASAAYFSDYQFQFLTFKSMLMTNSGIDGIAIAAPGTIATFNEGDPIDGSLTFDTYSYQGFNDGSPSYLGFKFTSGEDTYYGWAKYTQNGYTDGTLYGFAYDNTGAPIAVGATAVPEPGASAALAGLAAGSVAALAIRRRRKAAAAAVT